MEELKLIEQEIKKWRNYYNGVMGVMAFSFSLACLSIPDYISLIASMASLFMIGFIGEAGKDNFSPTLSTLRRKINKTPREKEIVNFSDKRFFANKDYKAFNFGMGCLVGTMFYSTWPLLKLITSGAW